MSLMDLIEDAWEQLLEGVEYFFSFEWIGDVWEFFGGMFEDIGDFSYLGLIFSLLIIIFIYYSSPYMLEPFLEHMSMGTAFFWKYATYGGSAVMGYLVGKRLWDN